MNKLRVYSDVAVNPEYKFAGFGIVISTPGGEVIREITQGAGQVTEMEARYKALITAFEEVIALGAKEVEIITSSKELVENILKKEDVEKKELKDLYGEIQKLRHNLNKVKIGYLSYGDDSLIRRAYIGAVSGANPEEHPGKVDYSAPEKSEKIPSLCPKCKNNISPEWGFCPFCGHSLAKK